MDQLLEFLNKWVARPISIIGAFLTIYFAATAIAAGDLDLVLQNFGIPELRIPSIRLPSLGPPPAWLVEVWSQPGARIAALAGLLTAMAASAVLLGGLLAHLGTFGKVVLAIGVAVGIWVWLRQLTSWFPDTLSQTEYFYEVDGEGRVAWSSRESLVWLRVAGVAAGGILGIAASVGYGLNRSDASLALLALGSFVVAFFLMQAEYRRFHAGDTVAAPALASCSETTRSQVLSNGTALREFIARNRPPRPHDKGPLASQAFLPAWYGFVHACARPDGDADFNRFRILVSSATRDNGGVRCDIAWVSGERRPEGVSFHGYSFLQSFVGPDCDAYHDGMIARETRKYLTQRMLRDTFIAPMPPGSAGPPAAPPPATEADAAPPAGEAAPTTGPDAAAPAGEVVH